MKKTIIIFLVALLFCGLSSYAQDTLSTKGQLSISGYVDVGYQYNFNKPMSGMNGGRIFDLYHNQFSLGLVQTVVTYTKGKLKGVADLTVGPTGDLANFGNLRQGRTVKLVYVIV